MRVLRVVIAVLLIVGLSAAVAADRSDKLMKEVAAIGDRAAQALMENDVDTMLSMYLPDAISMPNYGPRMDGIEAFKQHHQEMMASGMKVRSFDSDPTDVWGCGNQVIEIGTYKIALEMPGMGTIEDHGKYMTVYVRGADGKLKIKAETWNTDVNPMEMAGAGHGHDHE